MRGTVYEIIKSLSEDQTRKTIQVLSASEGEREHLLEDMTKSELRLLQTLIRAELAERGVII